MAVNYLLPDGTPYDPYRLPANPNPVGPWTNPFTDAHINPQTGQPEFVGGPGATIGPGSPAASGGGMFPNIAKLFGGLNPYARAGIAGAGIMEPTPAETGELPPQFWPGKAPPGVGGIGSDARFPLGTAPSGGGGVGGIGSDANFPVMGAGGFPTTYAAPGQQPAMPTPVSSPRPGGGGRTAGGGAISPNARAQVPAAAAAAPAGNPFTLIDRPNASPTGWNPGAPKTTALDLSRLFGGGQPAAANPANVPAANAQPMSGGPLSKNFTTKAPWNYGPLQKKMGWPSRIPFGPDQTDLAAGHSGYQ